MPLFKSTTTTSSSSSSSAGPVKDKTWRIRHTSRSVGSVIESRKGKDGSASRGMRSLFETNGHWELLERILLLLPLSSMPAVMRVNKNTLSCALQSLPVQCRLRPAFHGLDHLPPPPAPVLWSAPSSPVPSRCPSPSPSSSSPPSPSPSGLGTGTHPEPQEPPPLSLPDTISLAVRRAQGLDKLRPYSFVCNHSIGAREVVDLQGQYILSILCPSRVAMPRYNVSPRRYVGEGWAVRRIRTLRPLEEDAPPRNQGYDEYQVNCPEHRVDGVAMCVPDDVVAVCYQGWEVPDSPDECGRSIRLYKLDVFADPAQSPQWHPHADGYPIDFKLPTAMQQRDPVELRMYPGGIIAVLVQVDGDADEHQGFIGVWDWKRGVCLGRVECSAALGRVYDIQLLSADRLICTTLHRIAGDEIVDTVASLQVDRRAEPKTDSKAETKTDSKALTKTAKRGRAPRLAPACTHLCVDVHALGPPIAGRDVADTPSCPVRSQPVFIWDSLALPYSPRIATVALPAIKEDRPKPRTPSARARASAGAGTSAGAGAGVSGSAGVNGDGSGGGGGHGSNGVGPPPPTQYHPLGGRLSASVGGGVLGVNLSGTGVHRLAGRTCSHPVPSNITIRAKPVLAARGLVKLVDRPDMWSITRCSAVPMAVSGLRTIQIECAGPTGTIGPESFRGSWLCTGQIRFVLRDYNAARLVRQRRDYAYPLGAPVKMQPGDDDPDGDDNHDHENRGNHDHDNRGNHDNEKDSAFGRIGRRMMTMSKSLHLSKIERIARLVHRDDHSDDGADAKACRKLLDKLAARGVDPLKRLAKPLQPIVALVHAHAHAHAQAHAGYGPITAAAAARSRHRMWEFEEGKLSAQLSSVSTQRRLETGEDVRLRKVLFDGERVCIVWDHGWTLITF